METEVSRHLVAELQRLNARVARLEGFGSDMWKKTKEAAGSLMHPGGSKALSQGTIFDTLREFDKDARVTGDDHFTFTLRGKSGALIWDREKSEFALTFDNSTIQMESSLDKLKAHLKACDMKAVPANLHEYTNAVLRQQVRAGAQRHEAAL